MQGDWHAAVDIGGTFTDLLVVDRQSGAFRIEKLLTTHSDPAVAVLKGLRRVLQEADIDPANLGPVVHATTLVTNAVIERKGARTALLVTQGFRDILSIGREHRYDMYDVQLQKPEPLVLRQHTFGIPERLLVDGTTYRQLDEDAVISVAADLRRAQVDSVAICFLHAYRFPQHELRARELLAQALPDVRITLSHEVVGELREYERATTTVVNAYVLGLVDSYLSRVESGLNDLVHPAGLLVMLSSGALATTETARAFPVRLIESGPAAGALAAAEAGAHIGHTDLLSFDMGGTTAKACIISDGRPTITGEFEVARLRRFKKGSGLPLEVSGVELIEIGAGGGSLARIDSFGLLQVGPDSAGSDPGPVSYGLGGTVPTVTDADLLLGYLNPDYFLGGSMMLDRESAQAAIEAQLAGPLGVSPVEAAWYVHEVVNENMANAARVHAVERGADLERLPLFAFGGAGPLHACRVAQNLGISLVIAPLGAGVGSTIGLLAAPLAFDFVRTAVAPLEKLDWSVISGLLLSMEAEGTKLLERAGVVRSAVAIEHAADMRLAGQTHEVTVELGEPRPAAGSEARLEAAFEDTYRALFGRQPPNVTIEVVNWRVRVMGPRPVFPTMAIGLDDLPDENVEAAIKGHRDVYSPETQGYRSTPVYDRYRLRAGMSLVGPAIIEERESTFVVTDGARASVDAARNLLVEVA